MESSKNESSEVYIKVRDLIYVLLRLIRNIRPVSAMLREQEISLMRSEN